MKILFDIGHPAHVHLFRNARQKLLDKGENVFVIARDKEVTCKLLDCYNIDYIKGSSKRKGILGGGLEFFKWMFIVFKTVKKEKIDLVVSIGSPAGAWGAKLGLVPHIAFNDTETGWKQRILYYPVTDKVFSPECIVKKYGAKHVKYAGLHDLAYLRPEHFTPDLRIKEILGVEENEKYVILRFVSWEASHDMGKDKLDGNSKAELLNFFLKKGYKVFISAENDLPEEMKKYEFSAPVNKLHDALAFADLVLGDGATTATEAAVLGTPSIYVSSFAGELACLDFLESYGLIHSQKNLKGVIDCINRIIHSESLWQRKQNLKQLLDDTIDVSQFIADACLDYD